MKKYFIVSVGLLFFYACSTHKKVSYDFPPAMAANIKALYVEQCEKGKALYNKNCAHCHNTIVKGKTIIPDFTEEKLQGYSIRVANRKHELNMPDSIVTAEELALISTFLTYKKKNITKK
jgi:cytochrome c5